MTNQTFSLEAVLNETKEIKVAEVLCKTAIRADKYGRQNFGIKIKNLDSGEIEWINCYNISLHTSLKWGRVIRHWSDNSRFETIQDTGMTAMEYLADEF